MVFADGPQQRAALLCEQCAAEVSGRQKTKKTALDEFGRDLTADAARGRIDPVIGRAEEIEQTVEILARRAARCPRCSPRRAWSRSTCRA